MSSKRPFQIVPPIGGGPQKKPKRILIADDDRDNANMLAVLLRDEGHEVVVALRGDEALDLCRLFRPDVLIADINMPGVSGYAIARTLRERLGTLAPLLIAISGVWTNENDRALGRVAGFDHYLVKPVELKLLLGFINADRENSAAG